MPTEDSGSRSTDHMRPPRFLLPFAWAGAALFAASLVWFLFCYLVRFARPVLTGPVARPVAVNLLLFTAFALHHSLLARTGIKQRVHRFLPPEFERSLYTWTASLLFILVCTYWQPVPGVLYRLGGTWAAAGYLVQAAGLLLAMRASAAIDVLDLAGVRPLLLARSGAAPRHVPLETSGAYGLVRHPLYLAWTLLVFGTPVMTGTRATFAVISTLYLAMAIPWEERSLEELFGPEYERYRRRVKWRMIPGIY